MIRSVTLNSRTQEFSEVTILPSDVQKARLKANLKYIINLINDQTFLMDNPEKGYPVTPFINIYKAKSNLVELLIS